MMVLFISRRFYPDIIGGGQISAFYIAKAVKQQGNDVFVITFTDKKKHKTETIEGIKIFRLPIPKLKHFQRFSNLDYMYYQMAKLSSKYIKKIKPDIIHLLNFESVPLASVYYKLKYKKPIVATVNGPIFGCFTQNAIDYKGNTCINCRIGKRFLCSKGKWGIAKGFFYYIYSIWYMNMLKFSYKFVDRFFVVSNAMKPLMRNMGVPTKKISVVHNPIEIKKKVKSNLKKTLNINGKRIILSGSRLAKEKGIQYVIEAMNYIDNAVFLIVGRKKGYYSELKKITHKLNLSKKVKFIGFVNEKKMGKLYSISDVAILTGSFYEPLSRFLLEAASYGLPLIALDVGGNSEIIKHKKNGLLIKSTKPRVIANAITSVLNNKFFYKKMSDESIKKVKKEFNLTKIGGILSEEYSKILKTKEHEGKKQTRQKTTSTRV